MDQIDSTIRAQEKMKRVKEADISKTKKDEADNSKTKKKTIGQYSIGRYLVEFLLEKK